MARTKSGISEDEFARRLAERLRPAVAPHLVECKRSLIYDLSIDDRGVVNLAVDPDSGEPIRGKGRGFEQDILVFDPAESSHTSVVPRIVAEVKLERVNTHEVIVYSEKADRIRRVYPYVRYGFILGGMTHIPGRVLRLGQRFDFIAALPVELDGPEFDRFTRVIQDEAATSVGLTDVLFGKRRPALFQRRLVVE